MNTHCFESMLYEWLADNQIRLKPQTYAKYHQIVDKHIAPGLGSYTMEQLTVSVINQFLYDKSNIGRLDQAGGLSASMVRTMAFIIKSVWVYGEAHYDMPSLKGQICVPAKTKKPLDVLNIAEQQALEHICRTYGTDKDLAILFSLYTGMRLGEVCGLQWQNINNQTCTMHITHTVERIRLTANMPEKTALMLLDTKTVSSNRIIPFPRILLNNMHTAQTGFVVKGQKRDYADPRTLQYFFHKRLQQCGIRSIHYHGLRHTFATRCIESGMDMKTLSEILGHADVNITMNIYVHSSMEHKRKQIEQMAAYTATRYQ
ncbi:MAG: site-specific integrase [Peptococcaceae bacterium]|nr:site-specific integrase [Peptococcaceae bacterium]